MSADSSNSGSDPNPYAPTAYRTLNGTLDRQHSRSILEAIGLTTILEALEFALAGEPAAPPQVEGMPPGDSNLPLLAPPPSKFRQLYDAMLDPSLTPFTIGDFPPKYPIDTLMGRFGVLLPEILDLVDGRNLALALHRSGERLFRVIDGVGEAAEPRNEPCATCSGEGYLSAAPDPDADAGEDAPDVPREMCSDCKGRGHIRKMGNLEAAKIFAGWHAKTKDKSDKAGSKGDVNVNVLAQASAKAEGRKNNTDGEHVLTRVQKLIDQ